MRRKQDILGAVILLGGVLLAACKKDKVPAPEPPPEPTKWEVIAGQYKVYDTLDNYLYDMNIVHVPNENQPYSDSLRFENFDGEFTFTQFQSSGSNFPQYYMTIGVHNPLFDSNGNRWRIFSATNPSYNYLQNDCIILSFERSNLQYYVQDLTPYYECDCKQIAVKQ